jgi:hypothetical protein
MTIRPRTGYATTTPHDDGLPGHTRVASTWASTGDRMGFEVVTNDLADPSTIVGAPPLLLPGEDFRSPSESRASRTSTLPRICPTRTGSRRRPPSFLPFGIGHGPAHHTNAGGLLGLRCSQRTPHDAVNTRDDTVVISARPGFQYGFYLVGGASSRTGEAAYGFWSNCGLSSTGACSCRYFTGPSNPRSSNSSYERNKRAYAQEYAPTT